MRNLRVVFAVGAVSSLVACLSLSCAKANGDLNIFGSGDGGMEASVQPDVTVLPPDAGMDTGAHDTGIVGIDNFVPPTPDAGKDVSMPPGVDAGFDGGLVFFGNPGSTCATLGAQQAQSCGICGMQTSTCIVRPDGGVPFDAGIDAASAVDGAHDAPLAVDAAPADGSTEASPHDAAVVDAAKDAGPALVWSEWGSCTAELSPDAGCLPGTQTTTSCGTCGTQTLVCEPDCEYGATACVGQVDGGCSPGSVSFTPSAACGVDGGFGGTQQTCSATCELGAASACVAPPTTLTVPTAVGTEIYTYVDFVASKVKPLVSFGEGSTTCGIDTTNPTPYAFVTLLNPSTSMTATVSVVTYQVTGQPVLDTAVGSYTAVPTSTAGYDDCVQVPTDTCTDSDPLACQSTYGGLTVSDFNPVVIPAGGTVAILVQDQINDSTDLGIVQVGVRTESFP